jgi:hypothetical protein
VVEDEAPETEAVAGGFQIGTPLTYENEHLRQALAEVNDELVRARITIKFQNEVIAAMRDATDHGEDTHTH